MASETGSGRKLRSMNWRKSLTIGYRRANRRMLSTLVAAFCPFAAELFERFVGAGDPMIPEPDAQFPGGMGAAHEGRRQYVSRQRRGLQHGAACRCRHSCLLRSFRCAAPEPSPARRLARIE